ncbi:Sel1 domain protein repeat-containing protein [Nitrospirillum viridazoti Y2]|nr:Sel1 domain protein repeat-containing protein [Nitrospirillum amazonense Y2]
MGQVPAHRDYAPKAPLPAERAATLNGDAASAPPRPIIQVRPQRVTADGLRKMLANNPQAAVRWVKAAAQAGLAPAQLVFGQLLLDGRGIAGDPKAAFAWFQKAAATGDLEARNMVGRCYEQGWGVAVDQARATESFEIAAQAGHLWAQVNLAQMLMRGGDPKDRPRAFALFKVAAEGGTSKANLKAMNSLARFLEEGWAGPRDPAGALFWYMKAAKLGDHWAQYNLATILYRNGDVESADRWLQRAITNSDNGFRRRIASLLLAQPGATLRRRGLEALQRIAEGGQPGDLYAYGVALENGVAGSPDPASARVLFKTAAKNGHMEAADRLRAMRSPTKLLAAFVRRCRVMRPLR